MDSLDRAIDLVSRWKADRKKQRDEVLARLDSVIEDCQEAIRVWQDFLDKPGAPGDQWTIMSWTGPTRAKQLHEINLRAKASVEEVCRMAGPMAGRFVVLDEDVIEMAYRQLKPGESGIDAAKIAVANTQKYIEYLCELIGRVRSAKAPAASAAKSAPKKTRKKATTKPVKKKAAPKKK
ncbi:MAG: hypothetical protein HY082_04215 [Gammaproteobacteria bacterium]|nr:hypothetical protein [Gammaproteobacteria bacterium]